MQTPTVAAPNIPALEQLTAELTTLRASLEHAQRLATLGTIAGLIAHEFNNILTPVMSYAQMALAAPDDKVLTHKALERAAEGAERAAQIATAILDFAKQDLSAGSGPHGNTVWSGSAKGHEVMAADVGDSIRMVFECIARSPEKDAIELVVDCPNGLPRAAIRPVAVQQVLMNLVLNARRAMVGGTGAKLTVRARVSEQMPRPPADANVGATGPAGHGPWVVVEVEDNGKGIEPARMSELFKPFQTGDQSGGGNGLGLVVCRQLLTQAGGTIWAESRGGKGARFTVVIPQTT